MSRIKQLRQQNGSSDSCLDGLADFECQQLVQRFGSDLPVDLECEVLDLRHEDYRKQYCSARCGKPDGCQYYNQCLELEFGYKGERK